VTGAHANGQEQSKATISVGVKADTLLPTEVTRIVGVNPTRAFRRGELSGNHTVPAPWGVWALEITSDDIAAAAVEILSILEPRVELLREAAFACDGELTVGIFWQPEGGQGGYSLSSDVVQRLSKLGTRIDFYFC